jgi:hypothetical protein
VKTAPEITISGHSPSFESSRVESTLEIAWACTTRSLNPRPPPTAHRPPPSRQIPDCHTSGWINLIRAQSSVRPHYRASSNYSVASIYRSRIYRFPGSTLQFLWSHNKYILYSPRTYRVPASIDLFHNTDENVAPRFLYNETSSFLILSCVRLNRGTMGNGSSQ